MRAMNEMAMTTRRYRLVRWLVLVALLVSGSAGGALAQSDPGAVNYDGLDILFLVDQSGSMGGEAYGQEDRTATDPTDMRFLAVQNALDILGAYRLALDAVQMAVISFGDEAFVTMDWAGLGAAQTEAAWQAEQTQLTGELSADSFRNTFDPPNLGNTNFLAALARAQQMFTALGTDPDHPHLRVIVVLTDGEPCVVQGPNAFQCGNATGQQEHMDQVLAFTQANFTDPPYRLYVMALDDTGLVWSNRQGDWEQIAGEPGRAARVENSQAAGVRFRTILNELIAFIRGTEEGGTTVLVPGTNQVTVPPYQRELRLEIIKSSNSPGALSLTMPDGRMLTPNDGTLTVSDQNQAIEVWTVSYPQTGTWTVEVGSTQDRVDVFLDLIPINLNVVMSSGPFTQFDSALLQAQLFDDQNVPLPAPTAPYRLVTELRLTLPDGSRQTLPLPALDAAQGIYGAQLDLDQGGTYTTGLTISVEAGAGSSFVLWHADDYGSFDVAGLVLTTDTVPEPEYLVGNTIPLAANLTTTDGSPVNLTGVQVMAELSGDGQTITVPLAPEAVTDPASWRFSGSLPLETAGNFTLRLVATATPDSGAERTIGSTANVPLRVVPSEAITLRVVSPAPRAVFNATEGFPPLTPVDVEVVFETRMEESNALIDLGSIAQAGGALWGVSVTRDTEPVPADQVGAVLPGDSPGQYRLVLAAPAPGEYAIQLASTATLTEHYIFRNDAILHQLSVVVNPMVYVFWGGVVLLAALAVGVSAFTVSRRRRQRQFPAKGVLVLQRLNAQDGVMEVVKEFDLSRYGRNYIRLGANSFPRGSGIKEVIITSDEQLAQTESVRVTARVGKRQRGPSVLQPGGTFELTESVFGGEAGKMQDLYQLRKERSGVEGGSGIETDWTQYR